MANWSNTSLATLKLRRKNSLTDTYTFVGVNSSNDAGTPDDFLAAANRILAITGQEAQLKGITREITQEAIE